MWSPELNNPRIAVFNASVALEQKAIDEALSAFNSLATALRAEYTQREASKATVCTPLPGLPKVHIASSTALRTQGGLYTEVAALSKYIIKTSFYA
jgi:hypothetical protein